MLAGRSHDGVFESDWARGSVALIDRNLGTRRLSVQCGHGADAFAFVAHLDGKNLRAEGTVAVRLRHDENGAIVGTMPCPLQVCEYSPSSKSWVQLAPQKKEELPLALEAAFDAPVTRRLDYDGHSLEVVFSVERPPATTELLTKFKKRAGLAAYREYEPLAPDVRGPLRVRWNRVQLGRPEPLAADKDPSVIWVAAACASALTTSEELRALADIPQWESRLALAFRARTGAEKVDPAGLAIDDVLLAAAFDALPYGRTEVETALVPATVADARLLSSAHTKLADLGRCASVLVRLQQLAGGPTPPSALMPLAREILAEYEVGYARAELRKGGHRVVVVAVSRGALHEGNITEGGAEAARDLKSALLDLTDAWFLEGARRPYEAAEARSPAALDAGGRYSAVWSVTFPRLAIAGDACVLVAVNPHVFNPARLEGLRALVDPTVDAYALDASALAEIGRLSERFPRPSAVGAPEAHPSTHSVGVAHVRVEKGRVSALVPDTQ